MVKMIEIKLKQPEDFLKVKETLTRMGIANNRDRVLYQSCHILQKQGLYYVVHFKEMLKLDGRPVTIDDEDIIRRDSIAQLLEDWGLIELVDRGSLQAMQNNFRVITFKQKDDWKLIAKYTIGA
ncbi:translation repressor [Salmonella phage STML-198]|uniref:Translation repressor protein n=4 Tax=Gelderlandvirus TaxID=1913653 RepID=K4I2N8_9CAUD|nr:translation repressor [Salmonella phage STP4-a]YP_009148035.1 translation repressor [Salmonella phage STML-198]AFU63993.1 endoribonulcease translational repressor of early genes [Salmonella phage STML-198]AHJ86896.1 translational repressor protein [Salmonella phage STP4-a]